MAGEDDIFTTPMENFIRLMNRNNGIFSLQILLIDSLPA